MAGKVTIIDLRKLGLNREQWRALRLEAKELGVPMGILAEIAIAAWLRQKRRKLSF